MPTGMLFTEEQEDLRRTIRQFCESRSPSAEVRRLMADPIGYSPALWQQMADMGLLGLAVPEGFGGQGLGMLEQALVLEEMGRAAYPGPYFASAVLATTALLASGDAAAQATYLPRSNAQYRWLNYLSAQRKTACWAAST